MMSIRIKFSAALLGIGLILALLPYSGARSLSVKPAPLLTESLSEDACITVDQLARSIAGEDSTVRIIDLRSPGDFSRLSIPGSINIPYEDLLYVNPYTFLGTGDQKNIFYSNDDVYSGYALVLAKGMGFGNVFMLKGGLNEWINTVMNSRFTGERITARENAVFEARTKARRLFTEFNSLPDSLKAKLLESKKLEAMKLDGGCE
jgi:sulfur-carrier protein adenylyltransferase/sulfurtransferase